jgi:hypothetical protein
MMRHVVLVPVYAIVVQPSSDWITKSVALPPKGCPGVRI